MDYGDVQLVGSGADDHVFARDAESRHQVGPAIAGRAVHDGEEHLRGPGVDQGHIGIGGVAFDDGQAGVVTGGDLAVAAVEASAFGVVDRDHIAHFPRGENVREHGGVQFPGIAEFLEDVEAAAGRPIGGEADEDAG